MSDKKSTVVECQAESLQSIFILYLYDTEFVQSNSFDLENAQTKYL